ncbi:MAG: hypothetical protein MUC55_13195 [Burkholderiales bacterium]|nr:hypothetical protein [Burkholderiales bacterium]
MLRPLAMQHVSLWLVREDAPAASLALAELGTFCPDAAEGLKLDLPDVSEARYRDVYLSARSRLDRILAHCGMRPDLRMPPTPQPVPLDRLTALDARLGEIWSLCFERGEALRRIEEERVRIGQLLATLDTFSDLDVDLGALLAEHRFLDVRLGSVPAANLSRLREALALAGFVIDVFGEVGGAARGIVVGPAGHEVQIASLLATAGWRGIEVPPELRTHPERARADLDARRAALSARENEAREAREEAWQSRWDEIEAAETTLALAAPYANLVENALRGRGGLTLVTGWLPAREAAALQASLARRLKRPYLLKLREPERDERGLVPSIVRTPRLLKGFATLVHTYGIPRYGEIDPTALFALSFVLMFGMMFGDIGQGAVLAAAGFFLRGKLAPARVLAVACGVSSMFFGLLYGSVFGFEEWIHPLWLSPLSDPLRMLAVAVFWGVGFIVIASAIRMHNLYVQHGAEAALLDAGGAAGLVLYLGAVIGLVSVARGGTFGYAPRRDDDRRRRSDLLACVPRAAGEGGRAPAGGRDRDLRGADRVLRQHALVHARRRVQPEPRGARARGFHHRRHDRRRGQLGGDRARQRLHHGARRRDRGDPGAAPRILRGLFAILQRRRAGVPPAPAAHQPEQPR